jgi:hypothetical protein
MLRRSRLVQNPAEFESQFSDVRISKLLPLNLHVAGLVIRAGNVRHDRQVEVGHAY